jgi:hypothetical protein
MRKNIITKQKIRTRQNENVFAQKLFPHFQPNIKIKLQKLRLEKGIKHKGWPAQKASV